MIAVQPGVRIPRPEGTVNNKNFPSVLLSKL